MDFNLQLGDSIKNLTWTAQTTRKLDIRYETTIFKQ